MENEIIANKLDVIIAYLDFFRLYFVFLFVCLVVYALYKFINMMIGNA